MADDRWLSVDEIAEHLGVGKDSVYRWIDQKGLPAHKLGKLWKFKKQEVDDWVRSAGTHTRGSHGANASASRPTRNHRQRAPSGSPRSSGKVR